MELVDPRPKMKRLNVCFPPAQLDEIGAFARRMSAQFKRPVEKPEAIRLLCAAALFAERSGEKQPKARVSKS